MKNDFFKRLVSGVLTGLMCVSGLSVSGTASAAGEVFTKTKQGTIDGVSYELWNENDQGNVKMTMNGGASFSCEWSNIENCLFRTGQRLGSVKKYQDYGGIQINYDVDYKPEGNSYMCVYGWTQQPLVEYYIVEGWGDWKPPEGNNATPLKTVTINGDQYDIYKSMRYDKPSIEGNKTFPQYWSVKHNNPAKVYSQVNMKGTVDVSSHFKAWEEMGFEMGNLYEVALNIEGYRSKGSANVKKNDLTFGVATDDPVTPDPVEPDENGNYFKSNFESGTDNWTSRGSASVKTDSSVYYSGSRSLAVTGRENNWHGAAIALDTAAFVPGNSYSFGTAVLQNSGEATPVQLTLQYSLGGEEKYDSVDSATAASGEWTKLENTSFKIPSGATGLILYVEAPESLTDLWIDEAVGSVEGKKSAVVTGGGYTGAAAQTTTANSSASQTTTTRPAETVPAVTQGRTEAKTPGDANIDGEVTIADSTTILQYLGNRDKYQLTADGLDNADVYDRGDGVTSKDALAIQQYDAKIVSSLPVSYAQGYVPSATVPAETTAKPAQVQLNANYFTSSFDSGSDGWTARGSSILSSDSDSYYSGSKSIKVSGRQSDWNGIGRELDSSFVPGNTYSFSAGVMQASGSTVEMKLTLQYTGADGEAHYDNIAKADAPDKTWTKLENTSFTIPEGATGLLLYVETTTSLTDFYIDEASASAEGTKSKVTTGGGKVGESASTPKSNVDGVDISWIDPSKPMVAISFDDGAVGSKSTDSSMRIINAVADAGFHATFFYVGNWIRNTDGENEVKYAYSKGMEIANHSTTHPKLSEKSESEIRSEFDTTHEKLKRIIGTEPSKMLRLPYLNTSSKVESTLNDVALISCAIDTGDWNGASKDQIISKIKNAMADGTLKNSIVLCHETYDTTAAAMEYLAPYLKEQGWQIVTVSEMFAVNNKKLQGGKVYTRCS